MALLSDPWPGVTLLPGAERILAAHGSLIPQTDQFCGPFAAYAALHAVVSAPPSMVEIARAAGTRVWPHDVAEWRPDGAPLLTAGWESVPQAEDPDDSGTDAEGVVRGLVEACGEDVSVEHVTGPDWSDLGEWLAGQMSAGSPLGVVANVRTGPISPSGVPWDVGHFVVIVGLVDDDRVAIADSYLEMGERDAPPGCRIVSVEALARALAAPPGRSLIVLRAGSV